MRRLKRKILRGTAVGVALAAAIAVGAPVCTTAVNVLAQESNTTASERTSNNTIKSVSFDKQVVKPGDTISVKLILEEDSYKNIENPFVWMRYKPEGADKYGYYEGKIYAADRISLTPNDNGEFIGRLEIDNRFLNGNYEIGSIEMLNINLDEETDINIKRVGFSPQWSVDLNEGFRVEGSAEDTEAPVIRGINFDKTYVAPGDEIYITVDAEDPSDIDFVWISDDGYPDIKIFPDEEGNIAGKVYINESWGDGEVYFLDIWPYDIYGRAGDIDGEHPSIFIRNSERDYFSDDGIKSIEIDKSEVYPGEKINITVKANLEKNYFDGNLTDVNDIYQYAFSGVFSFSGTYDFTLKQINEDTYVGTFIIPEGINPGKYELSLDRNISGRGADSYISQDFDNPIITVLDGERPADYASVDNAKKNVPSDEELSKYTKDSVDVLRAALANVAQGKKISEQAEVDSWAEAIKAAINALELKKVDDSQTPISYSNTEGNGAVYAAQSGSPLEFVFKRSVDDDKTFAHFTGVNVDGKALTASDYKASEGSVNVELQPGFLATLAVGEHDLTALFDDGNDVNVKFTITEGENKEEPAQQSENITKEPIDSVNGSEKNTNEANSSKENEQNIAKQPVTVSDNQGVQNMKREAAVSKTAASTAVKADLSNSSAAATTSPETGDKNHTPIWIAAAGAAAATAVALAGVVVRRKKKTDE